MKWSCTTLVFAMSLGAGSLPASADVYDNRLSDLGRGESLSRSNGHAERSGIDGERSGRAERRRIARASISDDEDFDYRPRHKARQGKRMQQGNGAPTTPARRSGRNAASAQAVRRARGNPAWPPTTGRDSASPRAAGLTPMP